MSCVRAYKSDHERSQFRSRGNNGATVTQTCSMQSLRRLRVEHRVHAPPPPPLLSERVSGMALEDGTCHFHLGADADARPL